MIFEETPISGAFVVRPELLVDERGAFARTYCTSEFADAGIDVRVAQCSTSFNARAGTLRGMHYQAPPHQEPKLVRDASEILYQMSTAYQPGAGRGVRWDDHSFGIAWPDPPPNGRTLSERDATYPDYVR